MSRAARLQSARTWLRNFSGKRVVSSYAKWFGVDLMCAARELQILGKRFSPDYLDALRRTVAERSKPRRGPAKDTDAFAAEPDSDHEFAYIAGYTEAGGPFGVTWDEMNSGGGDNVPFVNDECEDDPF